MCGFALSACFDFKLAFTKASQEIMKLFRKVQRNRLIFVNAIFVLLMFDSEVNFHHSKTFLAYCPILAVLAEAAKLVCCRRFLAE